VCFRFTGLIDMVNGKHTGCMIKRAFRNTIFFLAKYNKFSKIHWAKLAKQKYKFRKGNIPVLFYARIVTVSYLKQIKSGAKRDKSN
jgi:hypothetical protein